MSNPDFKRAALLASLACIAYDTGLNAISLGVAKSGFNFIDVVESPGFQAVVMVNPATGEQLVDFRGTPVTCGRSISDTLTAIDADAAFDMIELPGGAKVLRAPYQLVLQAYPRLKAALDFSRPIIITGHSLGAVSALIFAYLLAVRGVKVSGAVFAPFQFANAAFHSLTVEVSPDIDRFGRALDFAPGFDHLDPRTDLFWLWAIESGTVKLVTTWPVYRESVADHAVTAYRDDLARLAA